MQSNKPKILRRTQFGNPVLRQKTRPLTKKEILSDEVQALVQNMKHTLAHRKIGVGLAATQVGKGVALTVIDIKPTPIRPNIAKANIVAFNPKIVKTYGKKVPKWEGCISLDGPFAKVPRFKKIRVSYVDEKAKAYEKDFEGLLAHVFQHEIDHLNGILFVDRVEDTTTYISTSEYIKLRKSGKIED